MRRLFAIAAVGLCVAGGLAWLVDFGVFEYRVARNDNPYGSVTVYEYYAIGEKNQRTEYVYNATEQQTCANAFFPHSGLPTCWYARRHTEKQVKI